MYQVELNHYLSRLRTWRRAEALQRRGPVFGRDWKGRPTIDHYSYGVLRCRIVRLPDDMALLYTDRGQRFSAKDHGKISFTTWMEAAMVEGSAPRVQPSAEYLRRGAR